MNSALCQALSWLTCSPLSVFLSVMWDFSGLVTRTMLNYYLTLSEWSSRRLALRLRNTDRCNYWCSDRNSRTMLSVITTEETTSFLYFQTQSLIGGCYQTRWLTTPHDITCFFSLRYCGLDRSWFLFAVTACLSSYECKNLISCSDAVFLTRNMSL
jgi:hypothetical protein